jgi:hypothetical protein
MSAHLFEFTTIDRAALPLRNYAAQAVLIINAGNMMVALTLDRVKQRDRTKRGLRFDENPLCPLRHSGNFLNRE